VTAVVAMISVVLVLTGCTTPTPTTTPTPAAISTPASDLSVANVDGAAAVAAGPGAPGYCTALVGNPALAGLGDALVQTAEPNTRAAGQATLASAARALGGIDAGPDLNPALTELSGALSALASGEPTAQEWDAASTALASAGKGLQATCNFPLS
jgi:hypothetical protein